MNKTKEKKYIQTECTLQMISSKLIDFDIVGGIKT